jgi:prolyl oligopeptidase
LTPVDQIGGPQTLLPQICQFQKADTPERLDKFIARLEAYPAFMDANIGILREGIESGLTSPRIVADRTVQQLERLLAIPIDEAIVPAMAQVASEADREKVRDVVRDVVYPADAKFLEALRGDYLAATRTEPGLWSAPGGDALYQTRIRAWTTLDLPAQEIHDIGLEELAAVEVGRREIARAAGFGDDTKGYRAALAEDPANTPGSKEELLARAREDIERAMAIAPQFFGTLPRAGCDVKAVEEFKEKDAPFAYYFPPSTDGSRPGIYYANGYDLPSRKFTKLASTTYHEAVPGHHFQIALEMENPNLNTFRRLGARIVGSAYVEGWGLYSEKLADEMGLFRDDGERFGMLDAVAWRAARLVVDTGIHALRWDRQRSIDFLLDAGLSETDATIETDRYIGWPGQALAYMMGCREIERLRREISARDGDRFDLREFHDQVLAHGSLPLATLARELPNWVATPA